MSTKDQPEPGDFWRIGAMTADDPASILSTWTIYAPVPGRPDYIARRFEIGGKGDEPILTESMLGAKRLETLRDHFERMGRVCITRDPLDAPDIVETWL